MTSDSFESFPLAFAKDSLIAVDMDINTTEKNGVWKLMDIKGETMIA